MDFSSSKKMGERKIGWGIINPSILSVEYTCVLRTSCAMECQVYLQCAGKIEIPLNTAATSCNGLEFKCSGLKG